MLKLIAYDLMKPGQDYSELHSAIKRLGPWLHYLESFWLVDTNLSVDQIVAQLSPFIDANDHIMVMNTSSDYEGRLPKAAWDWINIRAI